MNLLLIDKQFRKLNMIDDYINLKYEPRTKNKKAKEVKRHIYYDDLENDFVDEVNAYGFSPYIQQTSDVQRRDTNIMRFKTNYVNQGLLNYVKKKNKEGPVIVDYKIENGKEEGKNKNKLSKSTGNLKLNKNEKSVKNLKLKITKFEKKNLSKEIKIDGNTSSNSNKENFLHKALGNLARNKLNVSDEWHDQDNKLYGKKVTDNEIIMNKINEKEKEKEEIENELFRNELNHRKQSYLSSLNYKVNLNPMISISNCSQLDPNKLNLERFFNNVRTNKSKTPNKKGEIQKLVGLFKNNDITLIIDKKRQTNKNFIKSQYNLQELKEIDRNKVNISSAFKITSQNKKISVFKKLYQQSILKNKLLTTWSVDLNKKEQNTKTKLIKPINVNGTYNVFRNRINYSNDNDESAQRLIDTSPINMFKKVIANKKKK